MSIAALPMGATTPALVLLPGRLQMLLLVRAAGRPLVLVQPPSQLLEGLRAAKALLSFDEPCRDEPALDELLPWAGSV